MVAKKKAAPKKSAAPITSYDITPISELENNICMLVYGRSGTGKTEFSSTFPTPILVIDVKERGTETIAHKEGIYVARIEEWAQFDDLYWDLYEGKVAKNFGLKTDFASVVIDQVTSLQDIAMEEVRRKVRKSASDTFSTRNWGQLSGMLKESIQGFKELTELYNVCFIAHERVFDAGDEEDDAIEPSIGARVIPSVSSFLEGAVDAIGSTFIREQYEINEDNEEERVVSYCMRLGPHAYYASKIRRPVAAGPVPDVMVNPTYSKIMDLVSGKRKAKRRN